MRLSDTLDMRVISINYLINGLNAPLTVDVDVESGVVVVVVTDNDDDEDGLFLDLFDFVSKNWC